MGQWIIIQQEIIAEINKACKAYLEQKKEPSNPSVNNLEIALIGYIKDHREKFPGSLIEAYESSDNPITADLLKSAVNKKSKPGAIKNGNGVNIKTAGKTPLLLDLLCYFAKGKSWSEVLKDFGLTENVVERGEILKQNERKKHTIDKSLDSQIEYFQVKRNVHQNIIYKNVDVITQETFSKEEINDIDKRNKEKINFYLRFNNNSTSIKRSIANDIYIPPDNSFNFKTENGLIENSTINNIVNKAKLFSPLLIKILAIGGVGKSTLIWHFIKELSKDYTCYYIRRLDADEIKAIITNRHSNKIDLPIVFFLDDAVTHQENRDALLQIGELLLEISSENRIVFIVGERSYRYYKFKNHREFESTFSEEIYTLLYNNRPMRNEIFVKILESMNLNNEKINDSDKDLYHRIFEQNKSDSIIDSAFNLIVSLRKDYPKIGYTFDWEDWKNVCVGRFIMFYDLFKVVAFFYQFGISVPFTYINEYYKESFSSELLRELLNSFGNDYSPITLCLNDKQEEILSPRHEKLSEWYFQIAIGAKESGAEFFKAFLNNVYSEPAAYLFRNLCRNNSEFILSPYKNFLSNQKILSIITKYLSLKDRKEYTEEDRKMLMEKHFILVNLGRMNEAEAPLEFGITLHENNFHFYTRLAHFIEDQYPERSIELYKYVFEKDKKNYFAILGLFTLYSKTNNQEFENFQITAFESAKSELRFANKLIGIIEKVMTKLAPSTIELLKELLDTFPILGNNIAELLINKQQHELAIEVLLKVKENIAKLGSKFRNKTVRLFIKYHETHTRNTQIGLYAAEEILTKFQYENNSFTIFYLAKIKSFKNDKESLKLAEIGFLKANSLDNTGAIFYSVCKFYRNYSKHFFDKEKKNFSKAIIILIKALKFTESSLKYASKDRQIGIKTESVIFYNELLRLLYYHSQLPKDKSPKYKNLIQKLELENINLLEESISFLIKGFQESKDGMFSNYVIEQSEIFDLSKACAIYFDFCKRITYRKWFSTPKEFPSLESNFYIKKAYKTLLLGLEWDEANPILLTHLIEAKIILNHGSIEDTLEKITLENFNTAQKAKLSKMLFEKGYREESTKLVRKFGQLNSINNNVKNDLAFCYISAQLWAFTSRLFWYIENPNSYSLTFIRQLALDVPESDNERVILKIHFSQMYIENSKENVEILMMNICRLYYISGEKEKSKNYFINNKIELGFGRVDRLEILKKYNSIIIDWQPELVKYFATAIHVARTMILKKSKMTAVFEIIKKTLVALRNSGIKLQTISFNYTNTDTNDENLKGIVRQAFDLLFIISSNNELRNSIYEFIKNEVLKNAFYKKVFLHKLIKANNIKLVVLYENIIYLIANNNNDSDIYRMCGSIYLLKENFVKARMLYLKSLKFANNSNQIYNANLNLVKCTILKIEKENLRGFGVAKNILTQIYQAEIEISKCGELNLGLKWHEEVFLKLQTLKEKYQELL